MMRAFGIASCSTFFWLLYFTITLSLIDTTFSSFIYTEFAENITDLNVTWGALGMEYTDQVARVGDTVHFQFVGGHNVYIHPSGTCDKTDRICVPILKSGGAKYTFTEDDLGDGTITFSSDYPFMCDQFGVILKFDIVDEDEEYIPVTLSEQHVVMVFFSLSYQYVAWFVCDFVDTVVRFWGAMTNWE